MELVELVKRAQTGDAEAQGELYEKTYKRVYYLALRLTKSPEDAQDAAQDAFISAFQALPNLRESNAFEGWLFQITANKCRNRVARAHNDEELPEGFEEHEPDPQEDLIPEDALQSAEKRRLILQIIDELPETQRECVMLFYYSEMSVKQIAEALDCSEGTVKSRLNYARQKIKDGVLSTEERDNIRLHVFVPFWLLFTTDFDTVTAGLTAAALGGGGTAGTAAATGGMVKTSLLATLKAKVIAGITAAALVVGGGVGIYVSQQPRAIVFADSGMEQNMHLLLDIPDDQPILKSQLAPIYQVAFVGGGMNYFDGENWQGNGTISPVEGTVPVSNFEDMQYMGGADAHLTISIVDPTYTIDLDQIRQVVPHVRFIYHDGRPPQP